MFDDGRHEHHVVIVDDEPVTQELVRHALAFKASSVPIEVHAVASAEGALRVLGRLRGRVLCLIDHHLPGDDGTTVLDAVAEHGTVESVYMTGDPDPELRARVEGRVSRFILKPSNGREYDRELGAVLLAWIDSRHGLRRSASPQALPASPRQAQAPDSGR